MQVHYPIARTCGTAVALLFSLLQQASAQCGDLCGNTITIMFSQGKQCVNEDCRELPHLASYNLMYLSPDGSMWVRFSNWWGIPGVGNANFVCRRGSSKTASRSCQGDSSCKFDVYTGIFNSATMIDTCSSSGDPQNFNVALTHKAHLYSTVDVFKNEMADQ